MRSKDDVGGVIAEIEKGDNTKIKYPFQKSGQNALLNCLNVTLNHGYDS
jgi:hypothetical protein